MTLSRAAKIIFLECHPCKCGPRRLAFWSDRPHLKPTEPTFLPLEIQPQPDGATCGPTCLAAVYRYYGDTITLKRVIDQTPRLPAGGTLAVMLAIHALNRGYRATIYTFNLHLFDPTWFDRRYDAAMRKQTLRSKLIAQAEAKDDPKLHIATDNYLQYLKLGGEILFEDLASSLITRHLRRGVPLLTGLSSTYLYHSIREYGNDDADDDIRGTPSGHFVVIHGMDVRTRRAQIADPLANNPGFGVQRYEVTFSRLVGAIMLGVLTYDANLLVIEPATDPANGPP